jgi:hypothetical protein
MELDQELHHRVTNGGPMVNDDDLQARLDEITNDYLALVELQDEIGGKFAQFRKDLGIYLRHKEAALSSTPEPKKKVSKPVPEDQRIRNAPFRRVPRAVAQQEVVDFLADRDWASALDFSASKCDGSESQEAQYWRSIFSRECRTLHEAGRVERRDARLRGAMFEFRLIRMAEAS